MTQEQKHSCSRCGVELTDPASELCPTCGNFIPKTGEAWESGLDIISRYFLTVWKLLTQPKLFFRRMPTHGGIGGPLAFALVTHWMGSAIGFVWNSVFGSSVTRYLKSAIQFSEKNWDSDGTFGAGQWIQAGDRFYRWFSGAGPVIVDPFLTLASILFTSFFVFIGARLLISPREDHPNTPVTYESAVRILSYGMTPAILAALPLVGSFVASVYTLIVTITGVKEVYCTSTSRAVIIALFPKLLFFGTIFIGLLFFALTILQWIASVF